MKKLLVVIFLGTVAGLLVVAIVAVVSSGVTAK